MESTGTLTRWGRHFAIYICFLAVLMGGLAPSAHASPTSIEEMKAQLEGYFDNFLPVAKSNVPSKGEPDYYGGNWFFFWPLILDFVDHIFSSSCWDFDMNCSWGGGNSCYKKKWGVKIYYGCEFEYQWPIQTVESRRSGQDMYLLPPLVALHDEYREDVHYSLAESFHVPLMKNYANARAAMNVDLHPWILISSGPIIPELDFSASDFDLEAADDDARHSGGKIEMLDQIEYTIGPTLFQVLWKILVEYFTFLKLVPCTPPDPVPVPISSEGPGFMEMTRNPFLGFALYKDGDINQDLLNWILNPSVCTEYMMSPVRQEIPFDIYDTAKGIFGFFPKPLSPMQTEATAKTYDRMCTQRWGGSISVHDASSDRK